MKKFNLAVAFAAVATMAVASSASAKVERYQEQSWRITGVQRDPNDVSGFTHTFDVVRNPCDGSVEGDGLVFGNSIPWEATATITGFLDGNPDDGYSVTFTAKHSGWEYGLLGATGGGTTELDADSEYPARVMLT